MQYWTILTHHWREVIVAGDQPDVPILGADGEDAHPGDGLRLDPRPVAPGLLPLLHIELLTVPLEVRDRCVGADGDLADDVPVEVHHDEAPLGGGHVHLGVVRCPGAAGDRHVRRQHGGPVALACHAAHQHESVLRVRAGVS